MEELHCTKINAVVLNTCNDLNIKQLGMYKLRHKFVKCRSLWDQMLVQHFGMPDIEVLGILKIMCEVVNSQLAGMFNSQVM